MTLTEVGVPRKINLLTFNERNVIINNNNLCP